MCAQIIIVSTVRRPAVDEQAKKETVAILADEFLDMTEKVIRGDKVFITPAVKIAEHILQSPALRAMMEDAEKWRYMDKYANDEWSVIMKKAALWDEAVKDAALWRKVKEIATRNELDDYPCEGCPVEAQCDSSDSLCGQMDNVVYAMETMIDMEQDIEI